MTLVTFCCQRIIVNIYHEIHEIQSILIDKPNHTIQRIINISNIYLCFLTLILSNYHIIIIEFLSCILVNIVVDLVVVNIVVDLVVINIVIAIKSSIIFLFSVIILLLCVNLIIVVILLICAILNVSILKVLLCHFDVVLHQ